MAGVPEIRDALLDAAYDVAVTTGWQRARMADVAAAAGVSRQTLYDQFGSRDGLALALTLRETTRFLDGVERAMGDAGDDVVGAVRAAAAFSLAIARDNPLVRSILTEDGADGLLPYLTTGADPLIAVARERLLGYLLAHWPLAAAQARDVAELAVRLTLSYIVLPGPEVSSAAERIAQVAAHVLDAGRV